VYHVMRKLVPDKSILLSDCRSNFF